MTNVTVDQETLINEFIDAFRHAVFQATPDDKKDAVLTWASEFLDDPTKDHFLTLLDDPRFQEVISLIADQYAIQDSAFRIKTDELIKASSSGPTLPPLEEAPENQQPSRRGKISLSSVNIKQLLYIVGMIVLALAAGGVYLFVIRDEVVFTSTQQETIAVEPTFPSATTTPLVQPVPETQTESGSTLFAPAQTNCEYMVEQRLPVDANVMLYESLDFTQQPTIGPQPYIYHYVYKIEAVDAFIVGYENKFGFAPTSSFPTSGTAICADSKVAVLIHQGLDELAPEAELTNLLASPLASIVTGAIIILILASIGESLLQKKWPVAVLFILCMLWISQLPSQLPSLSSKDEQTLSVFLLKIGTAIAIGYGTRSIALVIRETKERTMPSVTVSEEMEELTKFDRGLRGIFDHFDWSYLSIFGGFLLALSLTWLGSILTNLWGFWGIVVALVIANLGLIFEALRRNKIKDWILYLVCLGAGLILGIAAYLTPHGSPLQTIVVLVGFLIFAAILVTAGLNKSTSVNRDQIPEGIYNIVINFLGTVAVLIHFFSDFGGLNF